MFYCPILRPGRDTIKLIELGGEFYLVTISTVPTCCDTRHAEFHDGPALNECGFIHKIVPVPTGQRSRLKTVKRVGEKFKYVLITYTYTYIYVTVGFEIIEIR